MWYVIYGGRQDYVNYYLGGREVTLELSNENRLDSDSLDAYWNKNRRSLLNYMAQATYGIHGRVTDGATGLPLEAMIHIPRHDSAYSVVHSSPVYGDFYRYIKEGAYDVTVSADGYMTDTTIGVQVNDYQVTRLDVALNAPGSSGSDMPAEGPSVHLYPNPAGDEIFISLSGISFGTVQMSIITPEGHTVLEKRWTNAGQAMPVRIQGLNSGIYFVRIISGELSKTFKIVKQ